MMRNEKVRRGKLLRWATNDGEPYVKYDYIRSRVFHAPSSMPHACI